MQTFSAKIYKIGINPYVLLPVAVLQVLFREAGKTKGAIPVSCTLNGHPFLQNLVKYSGKWRLYLNGPARKAAGLDVGDIADLTIQVDKEIRITPVHPALAKALQQNKKAQVVFDALAPSRQKEIKRYINSLKTEASVQKNIKKAIGFLLGKERFVGRDIP